ncbi:MAG: DUF1919 domain-containing protein, partial [Allobaculum sp.]|nr:DUF1919 domain-containing protein [Allobaculum sp.]
MKGIKDSIKNIRIKWLNYIRKLRFGKKWSKQIRHKNVSIISQNCIGGVISHDCGLRFNSPTINMWIPAHEFITLVSNLQEELEGKLENITNRASYPIGLLNGKIHIHFIHYHSFDEVVDKWNSRLSRVNYEDLRIVMTENDGCTYKDLVAFDKLPFKHKVVFTHKRYPEIKSSFYIPGFEEMGRVAFVMGWKGLGGKRNCDSFNWVRFLNGETE